MLSGSISLPAKIFGFGGLAPFLILKPLLNEKVPLILSQKIVSFLRILPISYPIITPPMAGDKIRSIFLKLLLILFANDLQIF